MFTNLIQTNLNTSFFGKEIEQYTWTESTNVDAWELIDEGVEEGTILITDKQTAGKGRDGRKWHSVPGKSLTISLILKPEMDSQTAGWFPLMTGVAIVEALDQLGLKTLLKWPNDILINNKKLGGILCESRIQGDKLEWVVIGLGINVNEQENEMDNELNATSFYIETGRSIQRELVLATILNQLESVYTSFRTDRDLSIISEKWTDYCHHVDKTITFKENEHKKTGIFVGINERGEAVISIDGKEYIFNSGDIHLNI